MATPLRRWALPSLVAGVVLLCLAPSRGDAAGTIELPFWKGSVYVPVGKGVKTTCINDITRIATCDGASCVEVQTYNCHPYGCSKDGTACAASCASTADCAGGSECNTTTGQCSLSFGSCADPWTIRMPNGQSASCAPYHCLAGKCQQQCSTPGDCAPGFTCKKSPTTKRYYCASGG